MKNEIKHPLERYKLIADPTIRQQCIENFDETYYQYYISKSEYGDNNTVEEAIIRGFDWGNEGFRYWENICLNLDNGTLPLLPEPIEEQPELDQLRSENEKLRECLAYWFSEHTLETTHSSKAHEYREKSKQLLNK